MTTDAIAARLEAHARYLETVATVEEDAEMELMATARDLRLLAALVRQGGAEGTQTEKVAQNGQETP